MTVLDPVAAVADYLRDEVGSLCDDRVYRPELPRTDNKLMPRTAVVVRPGGGYRQFGGGTLKIGDPSMDIMCYGSTRRQADEVAQAALLAMKELLAETRQGVNLKCARVSGTIPLMDPDTQWPYTIFSTQVICAEYA